MSNMMQRYGKFGIISGFVVIAVVVIICLIYKAVAGVVVSPELETWLKAPVSELKTWHLLIIVYIAAAIASSK